MPENRMPENQMSENPMAGNPMPEDEKTDLRRVLQGAEAIDSIRHAQEFLVSAGGFDGTLDTLDGIVKEIRADTGYSGGDPHDES